VFVENITKTEVFDADALQKVLENGSRKRHTNETKMNSDSSRSHLIFSILLEIYNKSTKANVLGKITLGGLRRACGFWWFRSGRKLSWPSQPMLRAKKRPGGTGAGGVDTGDHLVVSFSKDTKRSSPIIQSAARKCTPKEVPKNPLSSRPCGQRAAEEVRGAGGGSWRLGVIICFF
jgi:hypothetical protein